MKKVLSVLLIAVMMLSLSACGKKSVELSRGNVQDLLVNTTVQTTLPNRNDMETTRQIIDEYGAVSIGKHHDIELYAVNVTPASVVDVTGYGCVWLIAVNEGDKDMEFVQAEYKINGDDGIKSGYGGYDNRINYAEVKSGRGAVVQVYLLSAPYKLEEYKEIELTLYVNEPGSSAKEKKWSTVVFTIKD